MTAKQYLKQLVKLEMYIKVREEDYERSLALATQATQHLKQDMVKTSRNLSKQEDSAIRCAQISMDIERGTWELMKLQDEARKHIESLENNDYKTILTLRYLIGRSWPYIAEHMVLDISWVYRLHGRALLALEEILATKNH